VAPPLLKMLNALDIPQLAKHTIMWNELRNLSYKTEERMSIKLLTCWEFHPGQIRRHNLHTHWISAKFMPCLMHDEQRKIMRTYVNMFQGLKDTQKGKQY